VRLSGIAVSDEENLNNVYSVGAAVRDSSGAVIASLSGAVPRQGLTKRDIDHLCSVVKDAADSVSRKMGAPPESIAGSR
jgi:DNA-binding IclR family transcriptional regulator